MKTTTFKTTLTFAAVLTTLMVAACDQGSLRTADDMLDAYSSDYTLATRNALPSVEPADLAERLERVRSLTTSTEPAAPSPVETMDLESLQALLNLPPTEIPEGASEHWTSKSVLRKEALSGRVIGVRDLASVEPITVDHAERIKLAVTDSHRSICVRMGIDSAQRIDLPGPDLMMGQAYENRDGQMEANGPPVVHALMVVSTREVDGIPVEGSYVKTLFRTQDEPVVVEAVWPRFRLHPSIERFTVKSRDRLTSQIARRLESSFSGHPINVQMGVSFRPVLSGSDVVYVPTLKVMALSQDGTPGLGFWADLAAEPIQFEELQPALTTDGSEIQVQN